MSVISDLFKAQLIRKDLTKFDKLLENRGVFRKTLSVTYIKPPQDSDAADLCWLRWERELHKEITQEEWYATHKNIRYRSTNVAIRQKMFKLRHRWYMMPSRLQKMFPKMKDCCWRCEKQKGDFKHIWWVGEKLQEFIFKVKDPLELQFRVLFIAFEFT